MATAALATAAGAVVIDNIAGALHDNVTDNDVTALTLTGTVDARDFKFIADSLINLSQLDLSQAQIVAYSDSVKPLVGTTFAFPANELPASILMGCDNITTLILPANLQSIGNAALAGCTGIQSLELPASLTTIGAYAMSGTGITQLELPATVTTVGQGAWAHCHALTTANFNSSQVPQWAFMGDTLLTDLTLGTQVTAIAQGAFNGCAALDSIKLASPAAITTIAAEAFIGAGVGNMDISKLTGLENIGKWAFSASGIASAAMPSSLVMMGDGAFYYALSLNNAALSQGITEVPAFAFAGSSLSADGTLSEATTSIGDYAFYNNDCTSVFTLPASVSYLGSWAMAGMVGLDTINAVPTQVPVLGDSVWAGVKQSAVMLNTADNDIADLYGEADQWKEFHILRNYLMGDVNVDGSIDIADINAMCAYILGQHVEPFSFEAADINKTGNIDIADINGLIQYILSGKYDYIRKSRGINYHDNNNYTGDCITINDLSINEGETRTIEFMLDNSRAYSAFQVDIDMPQGLEIVPGSLATTSRSSKHTLLAAADGNRIAAYSSQVNALSGNEGAVFTLKVKATGKVQGDISITRLILATPQFERFVGTDSYAQVGSTTGVNDVDASHDTVFAHGSTLVIETENDCEAQVVAMNGMALALDLKAGHNETDMSAGVYVVRLNGKSHKVVIR